MHQLALHSVLHSWEPFVVLCIRLLLSRYSFCFAFVQPRMFAFCCVIETLSCRRPVEPRSLLWTLHTSWPYGGVTHVVGIFVIAHQMAHGRVTHVVGFDCPFLRIDSRVFLLVVKMAPSASLITFVTGHLTNQQNATNPFSRLRVDRNGVR